MSQAVKNYYTSKTLEISKNTRENIPTSQRTGGNRSTFLPFPKYGTAHASPWIQQQWPLFCERGEHQWHMHSSPTTWQRILAELTPPWLSLCTAALWLQARGEQCWHPLKKLSLHTMLIRKSTHSMGEDGTKQMQTSSLHDSWPKKKIKIRASCFQQLVQTARHTTTCRASKSQENHQQLLSSGLPSAADSWPQHHLDHKAAPDNFHCAGYLNPPQSSSWCWCKWARARHHSTLN